MILLEDGKGKEGTSVTGIFPVERNGVETQPFDLRLKDVSLEPKEKGLFQYKTDGKLAIKINVMTTLPKG